MLLKYCAVIVLVAIWTVPHSECKGGRGGRGGRGRRGGRSRGGFFNWFSSRKSSSIVTSRPYTSHSYGSRTYDSNNYRSGYENNRRVFASETVTQSSRRASTSHNEYDDFLLRGGSPYPFLSDPYSFYKEIDTILEKSMNPSKPKSKSRKSNSGSTDMHPLNNNKQTSASETFTQSSNSVSGSRSTSVVKTTPRNYVQHKPEASTRRSTGHHNYPNRSYENRNNTKYNETYETSRVHNSYYSGGGSMKNAVLAGLGGSALGLYLGHQLSNTNTNYHSHYLDGSQTAYPKYSFVHHYHRGAIPITRDAMINTTVECTNITFCAPNTQPLCLGNGTIYCLTSIDKVTKCNENSTSLICINTTLTIPCLNSTDTHCDNTTHVRNETVQIPCVTNLYVFGDFSTGKLKVHEIKNNSRMGTNSTQNNNSTVNTESNVNSTSLINSNTTVPVAIKTQSSPRSEDPRINYEGTINEFCVTVIAQPVLEPKNLTNAEFARYVRENEEAMEQVHARFEKMLDNLLA